MALRNAFVQILKQVYGLFKTDILTNGVKVPRPRLVHSCEATENVLSLFFLLLHDFALVPTEWR